MRTLWVGVTVLACVLSACTSRSASAGAVTLPDSIRTVRLNVDAGGTIDLEGKADSGSLSVRYEADEEPDDPTYEIDGDVLTLNGCGLRCSAHYEITLPGDVMVRGHAENGEVTLTAMAGVDMTTDNGDLTLASMDGGDVDVRTNNGTISGHDLRTHSIKARTGNALIDLDVERPQDITAHTRNGDIELTVPDEAYRVTTWTDHGSVDVGVDDQPAGEYVLDLRTENGAIDVGYR